MDNDFSIDLADIAATIHTHDVIAIRFVSVGQRLLLDFRSNELDGPMVKLVPPVTSVEERYRSLAKLRPRFAAPEKIIAIWWPRFARSLEETGIWAEVMERVADSGHVDSTRRAGDTFRELLELELKEQRGAITGEGFRTIWSASPAKR